jgi:predicted GIY-YIG superfamily endonuclease
MMYHVYIIICKKNGRIYVSQSTNPQKRFKQDGLKPPKKMLANINSYKPFVYCFELKVVFSSYRKYLCDVIVKKGI